MVGESLRSMREDKTRWAGKPKTLAEVATFLRGRGHKVDESALSRAERGKRGIDVSLLTDWLDALSATPGERAAIVTPDTEAA